MRATGMLLKVLSMLALTPGGGSNTKMRPARSRFTGTYKENTTFRLHNRVKAIFGLHKVYKKWNLGVDLHCQEEPEAGMRLHGVKLLFQMHEPSRSQVDILQHHPPATPKWSGCSASLDVRTCYLPARFDSSVNVFICFVETLS